MLPFIEKRGYKMPGDEAWLEKMVATLRERAKTLVELVDFAHFYLSDDIKIDPKAAAKFLKPEIAEPLKGARRGNCRITGGLRESRGAGGVRAGDGALRAQARSTRAAGARRADRRHGKSRHLRSHRGTGRPRTVERLNRAVAMIAGG